jgi:hypothetical protein
MPSTHMKNYDIFFILAGLQEHAHNIELKNFENSLNASKIIEKNTIQIFSSWFLFL